MTHPDMTSWRGSGAWLVAELQHTWCSFRHQLVPGGHLTRQAAALKDKQVWQRAVSWSFPTWLTLTDPLSRHVPGKTSEGLQLVGIHVGVQTSRLRVGFMFGFNLVSCWFTSFLEVADEGPTQSRFWGAFITVFGFPRFLCSNTPGVISKSL